MKKKSCKSCRKKFVPFQPLQQVCSRLCAIKLAEKTRAKKEKKQRALNRKERLEGKSRSWHLKNAQAAFNNYIRERDYGDLCISSGRVMNWNKFGGAVDAGHYRSVGAAPHLRFHLWNCHAQSVKDNRFGSGSAVDYRLGLIKKIGLEKVEFIERNNCRKTFDKDYLRRVTKIFRKKARILKKRRTS